MATVWTLAAGVAHEINTPTAYVASNLNSLEAYLKTLTEILACYEALAAAAEAGKLNAIRSALADVRKKERLTNVGFLKSDIVECLEDCVQGTTRIIEIVAQLRDFSRADSHEYKLSDINHCVRSTLKIAATEIRHKARIEQSLGHIPQVECNPGQINQVILNLLVNAAQAVGDDGVIRISTLLDDDDVRLSVTDNGCGMDESIMTRIFEPFFTTKEVGKGTGLGLSMSYSIIERHGGLIDVQSRPGEGTTVSIRLPVRQRDRREAGETTSAWRLTPHEDAEDAKPQGGHKLII
jgi:two-component system NtrC family sensor kinase